MQRVVVAVWPGPDPDTPEHPAGWLVTLRRDNEVVGQQLPMPATRLTLDLGPGAGVRKVTVPHSAGLGDDALTALLVRRALGKTEDGDGAAYGQWLHAAMFGTSWAEVEALADDTGLELAFEWAHDDHDLNALVWESMYAPRRPADPVTAVPQPMAGLQTPRPLVSLTRVLAPGVPRTPEELGLPVTNVPRVLFAIGAAADDRVVRPGAMFLGMLRSFEAAGTCVSRVQTDVSLTDLTEACQRYRPEIVHLVAHGVVDPVTNEVSLVLKGQQVGYQELRHALGNPVAVFLSACDTGRAGADQAPLAARLVHEGIPIVVGMAGKIGVGACRLFTRTMIEAVTRGEPLARGAATGRRAALWQAGDPGNDLDWALPTVFVSKELDPDAPLLDTQSVNQANDVIDGLLLGSKPVFCGRKEMLEVADALLPRPGDVTDPSAARGLFVIHTRDSFAKLGSRRLLREIACRFVRAGHVPLILGPFPAANTSTFAQLVGELLTVIGDTRTKMGLPLRWPEVLGDAPAQLTHKARKDAIMAFKASSPDPDDVKEALLPEFVALAEDFAQHKGPPFGEHTHVAVLGQSAHDWGDGLKELLATLTIAGLGRPPTLQDPGLLVPVVVTALLGVNTGIHLAERQSELSNLGNFRKLDVFDPSEAIAAYNWTLLQPWNDDGAYIAKEGEGDRFDDMLRGFAKVGHYPANLTTKLYGVVDYAMSDPKGPLRRIDEEDDAALQRLTGGAP